MRRVSRRYCSTLCGLARAKEDAISIGTASPPGSRHPTACLLARTRGVRCASFRNFVHETIIVVPWASIAVADARPAAPRGPFLVPTRGFDVGPRERLATFRIVPEVIKDLPSVRCCPGRKHSVKEVASACHCCARLVARATPVRGVYAHIELLYREPFG